jgi:hypothetical protein
MGYAVHITRKQHSWANKEDNATISLDEWKEYVASDPELQLAEDVPLPLSSAADPDEAEADEQRSSLWLPYSKNGRSGNYAWFLHAGDRVTIQNPDEEILGKMLDIAHALRARVQGDDNEYYDEVAPLFTNQAGDAPWTGADFRNFQTFASAGAAEPLLQALREADIAYHASLDTGQVAFDPSFANNQLTSKFIVQLKLADFERGSQVLNTIHQHALSQLDPGHYLFRFSDEELMDIVVKPDEWSALDVALAGQLLRKRGRDISPDTLQLLRQRRVAELAQPDQDHKALVRSGYLSALLGGFLGIIIGYQLYTSRKQLPTGQRIYAYSPTDRVHGMRIMALGIIVFLLVLTARLSKLIED